MDPALPANFPRLFPNAPTISNLENARSEHIIRGNRGRTISESESSGNVILCDHEYLSSLVDEMKSIEMKLELWDAGCKKPRRHFPSKYNPSNFLREALTDLADVTSHVQRLRDHPILFGDSRVRQYFFITATAVLEAIAQVLKNTKILSEMSARFEVRAPRGTPSPYIMHEKDIPLPPWMSFAYRMAERNDPCVQKILDADPALRYVHTQQLPAQGILIHEHWRKQVNQFVGELATSSQDPQRVLKQRVNPWGEMNIRVKKGNHKFTVVTVTNPVVGLCYDPKRTHEYALGEQEPVETGRASRLIAKLFGEYTTIGQPALVVRRVFGKLQAME